MVRSCNYPSNQYNIAVILLVQSVLQQQQPKLSIKAILGRQVALMQLNRQINGWDSFYASFISGETVDVIMINIYIFFFFG